ncbi:MAG: glutathione S-transferase N-terminal domain-containing protein [Myxococcales bacterium]|nr:glutathione S-transferase N-terminal domain-containing protein [Myxococcales bacterium]
MFIVSSTAASVVRFPLGHRVAAIGPRPVRRLELYDLEACPYCRKVREALSMLDLDVLIRPSPHGGARFRPTAVAQGGKAQFPLLVDPNHDALLYESDQIVAHLYRHYGDGPPPLGLRLGPLGDATSGVASVLRAGAGRRARASRAPAQPLALWSFELSPYSRRVREALCELELPYVLHNLARGSAGRAAFRARTGKVMVPYLEDPNTDARMFESRDIVAYLERTYGA